MIKIKIIINFIHLNGLIFLLLLKKEILLRKRGNISLFKFYKWICLIDLKDIKITFNNFIIIKILKINDYIIKFKLKRNPLIIYLTLLIIFKV